MSALVPPPPPPGLNYIAAIQPSLTFSYLAAILGSQFIPVLVILFLFSTRNSRSTVIFWLNVVATLWSIVLAILSVYVQTTTILEPTRALPEASYVAQIVLSLGGPLFFDSILLLRLLAFWPPSSTPLPLLLTVLAFPVLVKCGRFTALVLYFHQIVTDARGLGSVLLVGEVTWFRNRFVMTEWILEMVDNLYVSGIFLLKLRAFYSRTTQPSVHRNHSVAGRIRGILMIALSNFLFPVCLNIVQVVLISADTSFLRGTYVLVVNSYVTPLSVVFATVWTTSFQVTGSGADGSRGIPSDITTTIGVFKQRVNAATYAMKPMTSSKRSNPSLAVDFTEDGGAQDESLNGIKYTTSTTTTYA